MWIDYDDSQTFEDTEIIFTRFLPWSEISATGYVTIPNDTSLIGPKRLRAVTYFKNSPLNQCDTNWRGEAEDYTIFINDTSASGDKFCPCYSETESTGFKIDEFSVFQLVNNGSGQTEHYTHFPQSQFTTNLVLGNQYITTISKNSMGITGGYGLWIDYDDDGIFSTGEKLLSAGPGIRMISKLIHIPSDTAYLGTHRMRVRSSWGEVPDNPCGSVRTGETEDYDVTFVTSLSEEENEIPEWTIFPNPTNGMLQISGKSESNYRIFSLYGQEVQKGLVKEKISVVSLPAGVYIFQSGNQHRSFIKQ